MNLNIEDLKILDEALDAWINKDNTSLLLGGVFSAINNKEDKEFENTWEKDMQEDTNAINKRKRIATLLKAKIYELEAELQTEEILGKI